MPRVNVGGRELEVRPATLGFVKRTWRPLRDRLIAEQGRVEGLAQISEEDGDQVAGLLVDAVLAFVGHNEGVTREWVEDQMPLDQGPIRALLRMLTDASGLTRGEEAKAGPGAKSP